MQQGTQVTNSPRGIKVSQVPSKKSWGGTLQLQRLGPRLTPWMEPLERSMTQNHLAKLLSDS